MFLLLVKKEAKKMKKVILILLCLLIIPATLAFSNSENKNQMLVHGGGFPNFRCFVATAIYGDPNHNHVIILRQFRDKWLLTNPVGKYLVELYYQNGPTVANFIEKHDSIKPLGRAALLPIVGFCSLMNTL